MFPCGLRIPVSSSTLPSRYQAAFWVFRRVFSFDGGEKFQFGIFFSPASAVSFCVWNGTHQGMLSGLRVASQTAVQAGKRSAARRCVATASDLFHEQLEQDKIMDEEHLQRCKELEKYFTGRPFDTIDTFKLPKNSSGFMGKYEQVYTSPYILVDGTTALKEIYHIKANDIDSNQANIQPTVSLIWDNNSSYDTYFNIIFNYDKKLRTKYNDIDFVNSISLKFPQELKDLLIQESFKHDLEISDIITSITSQFPKYTFEQIMLLYVELYQDLNGNPEFIKKLNQYILNNIIKFHDDILEKMFTNLLRNGYVEEVKQMVQLCNETTHLNEGFLQIISPYFLQTYLKYLIKSRDILNSFKVLEVLMDRKYKPSVEIIQDYIRLSRDQAISLDSDYQHKAKVFNLLNKPLSSLVFSNSDKIMNKEVLNCIFEFIPIGHIPLLLRYVKHGMEGSGNFDLLISLIHKLSTSLAYNKLPDQDKAILLTSFLDEMEIDSSLITDDIKLKIIDLYAKCHSPLAVLRWSRQLSDNTSLNKPEVLSILESGSSDNVSGTIDISGEL